MEQYLCCFLNFYQDDWIPPLCLAKFAYNNAIHASTQQSPFFGYFDFLPHFQPELSEGPFCFGSHGLGPPSSANSSELTEHLVAAKESSKSYADHYCYIALDLNVGNKVCLPAQNLKSSHPSAKFNYN